MIADQIVVKYLVNMHYKMNKKMIETSRLKIFMASEEQMVNFIASQPMNNLKAAYSEMLNGCLTHPDQWEWYAIWMIELNDDTHIGELCFKGVNKKGIAEIGYGIAAPYRGHGYAAEAVSALVDWALKQPGMACIKAEVEKSNIASQIVLKKSGFTPTNKIGKEGLVFVRRKIEGEFDIINN